MPLGVPFDEPVGVLFERRVVTDVPGHSACRFLFVRRVAAGDGAGMLTRLDAGIITQPGDAAVAHHAPVAIVDPFEETHQSRPREVGASVKQRHRHRVPPNIWFSERANRGAGKATTPVFVHVRSQLVAGEPVDLVFFDAVEDDLVAERYAVGRAGIGALAADLAKVVDADVDGLVGSQR